MPAAPPPIEIGGHRFEWGRRTYVMGIVNVTPDSFSGDGVLDPARAADQAARMVAEGADLIDVGAESTRPGHAPLSVDEEWARLEAPLRAVRAAVDAPITVDTSKAGVASAPSTRARTRSTTCEGSSATLASRRCSPVAGCRRW